MTATKKRQSDPAMETSEEYIWLFERKEYSELAGSILGSVVFHALMFVILASTTIFHPLPGDSDRVDILWYYPSMSPGHRAVPAGNPVPPMAARAERPSLQTRTATATIAAAKAPEPHPAPAKTVENEKAADMTPPPSPPPKSAATQTARPLITVPEEEPETETEPEMVIPAAIRPSPENKAPPKAEKPAEKKVAERAGNLETTAKAAPPTQEQKKQAPAKSVEPPIREARATSPPASLSIAGAPLRSVAAKGVATTTLPAARAVAANTVAGQAAPARGETATAREAQTGQAKIVVPSSLSAAAAVTSQPRGGERKESAVPLQGGAHSAGVAGPVKGPAAGKEAKPLPAARTASEAKQSEKKQFGAAEGKGIFFPPVTGDLKLEMSGNDELLQQFKVVVLFREYPRTRRNRPLSRAEFRHARTLTPRVVRNGEGLRQAVIEVAGEGIYEFMVESAAEQPGKAEFALKLYEKSSKARTKPLGSRQIAQRESIVKVLMPEGILWSEDAAFSGSIEDSDSVTKFNSDTGLLWKEYK